MLNMQQYSVNYMIQQLLTINDGTPVQLIILLQMNLPIILASLFIASTLAQTLTCASGMSPSDLIQTGSITAIAPALTDNNRVHSFVVPVNVYSVPTSGFQITASLSQYLFAQNKSQNGYDFEVVGFPIQGAASAQIILFIDNDLSWTRFIISYIITSRKDLFLGAFAMLGFQFSSATTNSYVYRYQLPNWVKPASGLGSVAEFAGFRTSTPQIQLLKINSATIDPLTGLLSVNITANLTTPLELIVFSYVWWIQSVNIKFSAFAPQAGSTAAYQFIGLGSVSTQGLVYNGIAFAGSGIVGSIPCVGLNCPAGCISISDCISTNGIIANSTCFLCAANQIYQNFSCQQAISCGQNMKALGLNCVCQDGFFYVNSTYCVKCPANAYWSGSICLCNFGYYSANDTSCVICPPGSTYNQTSMKCDCGVNFNWFNGSCITCSGNQTWDSTIKLCVCPPNFILINSNCLPVCPGNSSLNTNNTCVCNPGFMNLSGKCTPCPPQSAYVQALQGCVCINGLYMSNGTCLSCNKNQKYDPTQNKCICIDNFYNISGVCSPCPNNSIWNGTACDCVNNYKMYNGTCVLCSMNEYYNGLACVCLDTFSRFGGVCSCPLNSQLIQGKCVCNTNFTMNGGLCSLNVVNPPKPECPEKAAWDGTKCVCIPGLNMINATCQACPPNSQYDQKSSKCFCRPGYYGDSSSCFQCGSSCKTCWKGGADGCLTCAQNYKLQGSTCVCNKPAKGGKDGCR